MTSRVVGTTGEFQVEVGLTRIWSITSSVCDAITPTSMKKNSGLSLTGRNFLFNSDVIRLWPQAAIINRSLKPFGRKFYPWGPKWFVKRSEDEL